MNRSWKRVLAALTGLAALLFAACTAWNWKTTRDLERAIGRLRAAGLPTSLRELHPVPLPPERNAAPLYRAAFAAAGEVPDPEVALTSQFEPRDASFPEVSDGVRRLLPSFSEALETVHQAARIPGCQFPLRFEDGYAMRLPHLIEMRALASLLSIRAVVRAREGDPEGAVEDLRALFAMSRGLREEPILVSQAVRFSMARRGLLALEAVLPRLPSAVAALERIDPDPGRGGIASGLRGEAALALSLLDREVFRSMASIAPGVPAIICWPGIRGPYLKAELALHAEFMGRYLRALAGPYHEAIARGRELAAEMEARGGYHVRLISISLVKSVNSEARLASSVELARLAARFLDHRRRHGAYPADLQGLEGGAAAIDPLTGGPYAIATESGKLVLRSGGSPEVLWRLP